MDKFINIKIIEAEEMYRYPAYEKGYHRIGKNEDIRDQPNDYGYHIIYETGYHSWCPAKEFEQRNKPLNPLRETSILMNSNDYKDRFVAEYKQLQIRYNALNSMCEMWDNGKLTFSPTCPREIYDDQLLSMKQYLNILEKRAEIENVNIK